MPYCTQDDLLALISEAELALLTAEAGDIPDAAVVAQAIAAADAEIDAYLAVRYQLPLAAAPARVKALAADLAVYHLYSRRAVAPEAWRRKYEDGVKFLKDVSLGRAVIVGAAGLAEPSVQQEVTEVSSQTRVFDRDKLGGW